MNPDYNNKHTFGILSNEIDANHDLGFASPAMEAPSLSSTTRTGSSGERGRGAEADAEAGRTSVGRLLFKPTLFLLSLSVLTPSRTILAFFPWLFFRLGPPPRLAFGVRREVRTRRSDGAAGAAPSLNVPKRCINP